jgi:HD-GYP domain-containing protein (c-di-GMP phosphodiesterase class II)
MNGNNITIGIILIGACIMIASMIRYARLLQMPLNLNDDRHKSISIITKTNFIMLFFFIVGYFGTALMIYNKHHLADGLVAVIFLFGSLFVFSVIFIQFEMSEILNQRYSLHTVKALVNTIEAKDKYTRGHSHHVASLCMCIHEHLPHKLKKTINPHMLKYAGYLHDIGKIGISDTILNKDGPLTAEEWKVMKTHPEIGKNILKSNVIVNRISDWVYYHHERIDGKGYYGLKGDEIPLEARLLCLADVYSAITTNRSYHKGKSHEVAIDILHEVAGSQLDAELVSLFNEIPKEAVESCRPKDIFR